MNKKRAVKFLKYFLMMFISLNFVTAIIVLTFNPGLIVSVAVLLAMSTIAVIIAARDVSYIKWF
jgi:hypothetical protein